MKNIFYTLAFSLLAFASVGQSYNNLQNYSLINSVIGSSRQSASARLVKAGYKLMTYQEVCQKEGEVFPKRFFAMSDHYRYTGGTGRSNGPWYVTVAFDKRVSYIEWNEYLSAGRGAVMDNVITLHNLNFYNKIEGPKATLIFYRNDFRNLVVTSFEGTRSIKMRLILNQGEMTE